MDITKLQSAKCKQMKKSELILNDFEGFDQFIFRGKTPNWEKLYNKERDIFYPPIPFPKTEVEHQLDHYALWMVMAHYKLTSKPDNFRKRGFFFRAALQPCIRCYACEWHNRICNSVDCIFSNYCPLTSSGKGGTCGYMWGKWQHLCIHYPEETEQIQQTANAIAHIEWGETP